MHRMKWLAVLASIGLAGCGLAKDEHGYPEVVKSNFITACTKAGSTAQLCNCALGKFETRVSYETFREQDANATAGKPLSPEFEKLSGDILRECATAK